MPDITTTRGFVLPWGNLFEYRRRRMVGCLLGALKVLVGKSVSVPRGIWNTRTSYGQVEVRSYYGGLLLKLPDCDLYWTSKEYDGWGAGPGQGRFDREFDSGVPRSATPRIGDE